MAATTRRAGAGAAVAAAAVMLAAAPLARASSFDVIYGFAGGLDGGSPHVTVDGNGNILGVGQSAGKRTAGAVSSYGTAFAIAPATGLTTLHVFQGPPDGANPRDVVADPQGNLYGASFGGPNSCAIASCGELFKIAPGSTTVQRLHAFKGGSVDGAAPTAIALDAAGNIYGVTYAGGNEGCYQRWGCGTVFTLTAAGTYHVLYRFFDGADGANPDGNVVIDAAGNVYGTASDGANGQGLVFKVSPAGAFTVLHAFTGGADGAAPNGLVLDAAGTLYGAAFWGGANKAGLIYKIDSSGAFSVAYNFQNKRDGGGPGGRLAIDPSGTIYGTAEYGGSSAQANYCANAVALNTFGCGVLFALNAAGSLSVIHAFSGGADGGTPNGIVRSADGHLVGATASGGARPGSGYVIGGTIYQATP